VTRLNVPKLVIALYIIFHWCHKREGCVEVNNMRKAVFLGNDPSEKTFLFGDTPLSPKDKHGGELPYSDNKHFRSCATNDVGGGLGRWW
jgi:hypothetical protein